MSERTSQRRRGPLTILHRWFRGRPGLMLIAAGLFLIALSFPISRISVAIAARQSGYLSDAAAWYGVADAISGHVSWRGLLRAANICSLGGLALIIAGIVTGILSLSWYVSRMRGTPPAPASDSPPDSN